tara:strand:+ start:4071 stop:5129 length:1059 start_codon:yes stop_codon:yes gene_type:complete
MTIRKTSKQIKEEILSHLIKGPLSTKKISDLLGSNWSTINNCLDELRHEGKVREIYSRENLKIYVRSDYPVFYGLPLDEEKLKSSLALLSKIVKRWNAKNKVPIAKTPLQKIAVELIRNNSLNIPVVRFHYGKVLTTYFEPEKSQEIIDIYGTKKINLSDEIIDDEIKKHENIAWIEKKKQYKNHLDMKIFHLSDRISYLISNNKTEGLSKIGDLFNRILLEIPTDERYSYLFTNYHEFLGVVNFILNSKEFEESKEYKKNFLKEILDAFNSLWQALTTEFFFKDIESSINEEFKEIVQFIKDSKIKTYYSEIDEKLSNLLDYKKTLTPKKIKVSDDEKKILGILLEGANEE